VTPLQIDAYSDIVCPWCFIGTRRLQYAIGSLDPVPPVELRYRPYLLHPDAPPDGIDLRDMLSQKYGGDPRRMFERVEAAARDAGIPLDFSRLSRTYSTLAAHTLLRHAREKGTQRELADALFTAYFIDARNISDADVLADVAGKHGFAEGEVERLTGDDDELVRTGREAQAAAISGIRGVPHFVLNGRYSLSGAQPVDLFRTAIARAQSAD
jgi:predicted DsbA family dithiol-disulfide isomerase